MKSFSITDIERLSGIKAHSLRIWEKRYGMPVPLRINNGIRHYSLSETKKILLIGLLKRYGFRISQLLLLSEEEITRRISNFNDDECQYRLSVHQLLFSMYSMNTDAFEMHLDQCLLKWPDSTVITKIIEPFLKYSGLLWQGSRLTEEHLVVPLIRKKLLGCIEKIGTEIQYKKTVLLFLSDSRQLDLSLLHAFYVLRLSGLNVIYMGNDVSIDNLTILFDALQPTCIYTYLPAKNNFQFEKMSSIMEQKLPDSRLFVTLQSEKFDANYSEIGNNIIITSFPNAMDLIKDN